MLWGPLLAVAAFAMLLVGSESSPSQVGATSCADQVLQPVGAPELSACGVPGLRANSPRTAELHHASASPTVATEAGIPRTSAQPGRAGSASTAGSGGGAAGPLPARKTIDVSQLPPELVSPSR